MLGLFCQQCPQPVTMTDRAAFLAHMTRSEHRRGGMVIEEGEVNFVLAANLRHQ